MGVLNCDGIIDVVVQTGAGCTFPANTITSTQCWPNDGQTSQTVGHHLANIWYFNVRMDVIGQSEATHWSTCYGVAAQRLHRKHSCLFYSASVLSCVWPRTSLVWPRSSAHAWSRSQYVPISSLIYGSKKVDNIGKGMVDPTRLSQLSPSPLANNISRQTTNLWHLLPLHCVCYMSVISCIFCENLLKRRRIMLVYITIKYEGFNYKKTDCKVQGNIHRDTI